MKNLFFSYILPLLLLSPVSWAMAANENKEVFEAVEKVLDNMSSQAIIETALDILESAENFTPETFEKKYDDLTAAADETTKSMYTQYRTKRIEETLKSSLNTELKLDRSTVQVKNTSFGKIDLVNVQVDGTRSWWGGSSPKTSQHVRYVIMMTYDRRASSDQQIKHRSWTMEILTK